ncbi:class I SAM-dependent methyltransferase [candidate division WWE3 bacterium]|uniref:Class I SAM-dependent methyltransferase n=1 Tax=candidate division WWE3 bacterium TaxID=2053526 RepID=A0A955LVJ7_UNCKA|nr:class I SAM-dependent methyltransferase [candidate division WWE3 bacterium]
MSEQTIDVSDYDRSGYDYRQYWDKRQYDNAVEQKIISQTLPHFSESLIDIGGGFGRLISSYQDKAKHITVFDYSNNNLNVAQSIIEAKGYEHIQTQQGDIYSMPFKDASFDTAIILRVIHHLERTSLALHEINRVMKPSGTLILQFANKVHLKNRLKALITRDATIINPKPVNLSKDGIFFQFHPDFIKEKLKENGFVVEQIISSSNIRIPFIYRMIPVPVLLFFETLLTPIFTKFYLGPSIFVIARKQ